MSSFNWTCPFCGRDTVVTIESVHEGSTDLEIENASGPVRLEFRFIVCPGPKCRKFTLTAGLVALGRERGGLVAKGLQYSWGLIPATRAKAFPGFIPKPILGDYNEACLVAQHSPKATAALCRRALQKMLIDCWHVKPSSLWNQIQEILPKIDSLTASAFEAVCNAGPVGAHFKNENVDSILDAEPAEAEMLLNLLELLLREWYVAKQERHHRVGDLLAMINKVGTNPDAQALAAGT